MQAEMAKSDREQQSRRMCAGCGGRAEPDALIRLVVGPAPPFVCGRPWAKAGAAGGCPFTLVAPACAKPCGAAHSPAHFGEWRFWRPRASKGRSSSSSIVASGAWLARQNGAGHIALGTEAVREALASGRGQLLVVAADARGRGLEIRRAATAIGCATATWGTKASVGDVFSRQELALFLITDPGFARAILECLAQVEALSEDE